MNILVTLNSGLGADTGPNFNLTTDVGSVTPSSATKAELLAGKLVDVDPSATQITVTSVGTCTTSIVLTITGQTTTTSTSTTSTSTTTTTSPETFSLGYHGANFFSACLAFGTSPTTYYAATGQILQIGTILYTDQTLSTVVLNGFFSDGTNWWRVTGGLGEITSTGSCSTTSTTSTTSTSTSTTSTTSTTTQASTTTTTLAADIVSLGFHATVGWQSCYATQTTYYIPPGATLQNGTFIYTDSGLTTKPIDGYYSNGTNYWYSTDGELSGETACPTTTTTSTTTTTTTAAPTTTTTTAAPTTTTTTAAPTTTTTTTEGPTTTTTAAPQCNYDGFTIVCDSTTTTTTAAPTTTTTTAAATTTTTTSAPSTQLFVYAKYINTGGELQYSINGGTNISLGTIGSTSCDYVATITGITVGDDITFTDVINKTIASSTSVCPDGPGGFACSVSYSVLSSGAQYVYITIDGSNIC